MNAAALRRRSLWHAVAAALIPVLLLLPFAAKAYHIDDTFYLWVAEQILEDPSDYYGFTIAWGLVPTPAYEANKNPPGVSYYYAAVASVTGWNEVPLHLSVAAFTALLTLAAYLLARRVCAMPLHAALMALLTPAVLVSSNTVMSDVPMYALYVFAILLWMIGLDRRPAIRHSRAVTALDPVPPRHSREGGNPENRHRLVLIAAALLMGLATLTKYFGATAIPLAALYAILKSPKRPSSLLYLLIPLAMIGAYQVYSHRLYGISLLGDAASFAMNLGWREDAFPIWAKPFAGLSFLGGCAASVIFYAPYLWGRRTLLAGTAAVALLTITLAFLARTRYFPGIVPRTPIVPYMFQYALFIAAGLQIMALAIIEFRRRPTAETTLLVVWLMGTFLFSTFVNWTINARTMLPVVVPTALLLARRLEWRLPPERWTSGRTHAAPLAAAAALSLCVMWGDFRLANSARDAAAKFTADAQVHSAPYFYKGNWGFQYYMERGGVTAFQPQRVQLTQGTRIVVPVNNVVYGRFNPQVARAYRENSLLLPASRWISTMRATAGAGFYTHFAGALPYVFGPVPLEEYAVYELNDYQGLAAAGQQVPIEFYELPE